MSGTELVLDHVDVMLRTTAEEETRARRVIDEVLRHGLDAALLSSPLPDGEWCLRHLDIELPIDDSVTDRQLQQTWAESLLEQIRRALDTTDVVHFDNRRAALVALLEDGARRRVDRSWAFAQVGLIPSSQADLAPSPVAVIEAAISEPQMIVGVIIDVVSAVGFPQLDRLLGVDGWVSIARCVAVAHGVDAQAAGLTELETQRVSPSGATDAVSGAPPGSFGGSAVLFSRSLAGVLASAVRGSGLRLDSTRAEAIAVLCLAEQRPEAFEASDLPGVLLSAADELRSGTSRTPGFTPSLGCSAGPEPSEPEGRPTEWAGLLFLLNLLVTDGVLHGLRQGELADRPLRWALHHLAGVLAAMDDDDPARRAFCGLEPSAESPAVGATPPTPAERAVLCSIAESIRGRLRELLSDDNPDVVDPISLLCRRLGLIVARPGWIEVRLPLSTVDVRVRATGLDLDPGWIASIGAVVKVIYA